MQTCKEMMKIEGVMLSKVTHTLLFMVMSSETMRGSVSW